LSLIVKTIVTHAKRRDDEIKEIAEMFKDMRLDNAMSISAKNFIG